MANDKREKRERNGEKARGGNRSDQIRSKMRGIGTMISAGFFLLSFPCSALSLIQGNATVSVECLDPPTLEDGGSGSGSGEPSDEAVRAREIGGLPRIGDTTDGSRKSKPIDLRQYGIKGIKLEVGEVKKWLKRGEDEEVKKCEEVK